MVKKLFGGASITALAGFLAAAGCSSTTTNPQEATFDAEPPDSDRGPADSPPDGATTPQSEGGVDADSGRKTCPSTDIITSAAIDAQLGWKPAGPLQNVCSDAEVAKFDANVQAAAKTNSLKS